MVRVGLVLLRELVDSGSSHNFINTDRAPSTGLPTVPRKALRTTVANGDKMSCLGVLRRAPFSIVGKPLIDNIFVLPLGGYDMVLGTRWLASLGSLNMDFGTLTMVFWHDGRLVQCCGEAGHGAPSYAPAPQKNAFAWSAEAMAAFVARKLALTTTSVLTLPDFTRPFIVECDVSCSGFGAVLHQDDGAIAFFSCAVAAGSCTQSGTGGPIFGGAPSSSKRTTPTSSSYSTSASPRSHNIIG